LGSPGSSDGTPQFWPLLSIAPPAGSCSFLRDDTDQPSYHFFQPDVPDLPPSADDSDSVGVGMSPRLRRAVVELLSCDVAAAAAAAASSLSNANSRSREPS
jgi:hypothetical protein